MEHGSVGRRQWMSVYQHSIVDSCLKFVARSCSQQRSKRALLRFDEYVWEGPKAVVNLYALQTMAIEHSQQVRMIYPRSRTKS